MWRVSNLAMGTLLMTWGLAISATASAEPCPPDVLYYHQDATGNLVAMTDDAGLVVWRAEIQPFGQGSATPASRPLRFVERPREVDIGEEDGLYHMGVRYYDPLTGRFLSPDPLPLVAVKRENPQRLNCYSYALNNPYSFHDSRGLEAEKTGQDSAKAGAGGEGGITGWDLFKWLVNTLDWTRAPLSITGILGLTSDTVGLFATQAGHKDIALGADVAGKGVSIYTMVRSLSMSWVGGTLMYLEAVKRWLDASEELRQAMLDPNATNGFVGGTDYNRYSVDQVKAWCEGGSPGACYNYVARGGKVEDLRLKKKEKAE